ncbi:MAG TPA: LiaF-related protein [Ignavibacteriaceae bacterium]|nr:LiaF-related protein [Ignavibacteriaceae bacterium]
MSEMKNSTTRMIVGIIFLFLGAMFLLDNLNIADLNLPRHIFSFPALLILIGLISLINSNRKGFGISLIIIGGIWLGTKFVEGVSFGDIAIPLVLLFIGFNIMFRSKVRHKHFDSDMFNIKREKVEKDKIDDMAIFGGGEKYFVSENFQGGNITAIFGGSEIYLTDCKLAPGENVIDLRLMFGGTTIFVPRDWHVIVDVVPIFGGFSSKNRRFISEPGNPDRSLIIRGTIIFGGGEVKSF